MGCCMSVERGGADFLSAQSELDTVYKASFGPNNSDDSKDAFPELFHDTARVFSDALRSRPEDAEVAAAYGEAAKAENGLVLSLSKDASTLYDIVFSKSCFDERDCLGTIERQHTWQDEFVTDKDGKQTKNRLPKIVKEAGEWEYLNYKQVKEQSRRFGSFLVAQGMVPHDSRVSIWAGNSKYWVMAEQGCVSQALSSVSVYDTLGPDAAAYITADSGSKCLVCEETKFGLVSALLQDPVYQAAHGQIELVVTFGAPKGFEEQKAALAEAGIKSFTWEEATEHKPSEDVPPVPEDLATIMYTSGTTGMPKGVKLSHKNLLSTLSAVMLTPGMTLNKHDLYVSYLPLAHIFERINQIGLLNYGAKIAFASNSSKALLPDLQTLKPTVFAGVPKVYERVRDAVKQGLVAAGGMKQSIGEGAIAAKIRNLEDGSSYCCLYDSLFFSKVKQAMGGKVRICITGGAPISKPTLQFIRACFSCIVQGYGATETSAAATLTLACDVGLGHVGVPMPNTKIKLVDVPEMNYFAAGDGQWRAGVQGINADAYKGKGDSYDEKKLAHGKCGGEIWIYGHGVSSGYYDPSTDDVSRGVHSNGMHEKNQEDFMMEDGNYWFKTGDIGRWNMNGTLSIVDRKKNIFKISIGEYIAVEKVEKVYYDEMKGLMDQIMVPKRVKNTSGQDIGYIGLVAVMNAAGFSMAQKDPSCPSGLPSDPVAAVASSEFKAFVWDKLAEVNKQCGLQGSALHNKLLPFERIKKADYFHLEYVANTEDWINDVLIPSPEALDPPRPEGHTEQLLTATSKPRRAQLDLYFNQAYQTMYVDE
eukprot:TRINITY_DN3736_c0_g2_i2.p1 TRINITY_DN3736_c0_g2~~TRINITY_DN3736_c0_g2_i2.p1  ORF type:complete len:815 (+),score=295.22 TRINITY_DN3736_c0_g2_i2:167-2611(+)